MAARVNITAEMLYAALRSIFYAGITPPAPVGCSLAHWHAAIAQFDRSLLGDDTIDF